MQMYTLNMTNCPHTWLHGRESCVDSSQFSSSEKSSAGGRTDEAFAAHAPSESQDNRDAHKSEASSSV